MSPKIYFKTVNILLDHLSRYQVKFFVSYENASLCQFVIWDEEMKQLLGKTAQELIDENEDYQLLPPPNFMSIIDKEFVVKIRVTKTFNIEQNSKSYSIDSMCGDERTVAKWKEIISVTKEQVQQGSSSTHIGKSDESMESVIMVDEDEPVSISEEMTPQRFTTEDSTPTDKFSSTKLNDTKLGKAPII
ncbi:hypothetical protein RND81_12G071900 [Saponaria officinalis]|uniref:Replication factor A C-terminal domain-containing protein n=1 Tax=Saponaria officinalis TaxID=3572 RepID=A0AAW1H7L7_SAPOF